ncbi:DNA repair protein RadC [Candidatus Dependentiae bacterium]|nr:DNA repair protein RadC [Candidatus Dependentiae bacterium]
MKQNFKGPREKLLEKGAKSLSDTELLAVLLGSSTQKADVFTISKNILKTLDAQKSGEIRLETLQKIEGVGLAKACVIIAALEFSRRRIKPEGIKITAPTDILPLLQHYADRKQEHFICISVNGANEVIKLRVVSVGLVNKTQAHPREVFADPITDRASAIIIAHNHTSGSCSPSAEDIEITKQLTAAGNTLGIKLLDHIIFNKNGYYSFLEENEL